MKTIWTIGHATHAAEEFTEMLQSFQIETLVDIRSLPGSNKFPQFNKENLKLTLPHSGIQYMHLVNLGGLRKTKKGSHNTGWRLASFRGYADYMETPEFFTAIHKLESIASKSRTAIMCAEVLWWRCHRSLVSDFLKLNGWKVMHIMAAGKASEHTYTKPAIITNNKLTYP
ncbi:MAG: DUF488 domain-containing protein [Porphyromonadaceae bacterium]|nr:DUF488 domain-containing protein [Porphyromonadaceae bacterium]